MRNLSHVFIAAISAVDDVSADKKLGINQARLHLWSLGTYTVAVFTFHVSRHKSFHATLALPAYFISPYARAEVVCGLTSSLLVVIRCRITSLFSCNDALTVNAHLRQGPLVAFASGASCSEVRSFGFGCLFAALQLGWPSGLHLFHREGKHPVPAWQRPTGSFRPRHSCRRCVHILREASRTFRALAIKTCRPYNREPFEMTKASATCNVKKVKLSNSFGLSRWRKVILPQPLSRNCRVFCVPQPTLLSPTLPLFSFL